MRRSRRKSLPVRERSDFPRLQTIAVGMDERDLRLLLMVAAFEARECPRESPIRIAAGIVEALRPTRPELVGKAP